MLLTIYIDKGWACDDSIKRKQIGVSVSFTYVTIFNAAVNRVFVNEDTFYIIRKTLIGMSSGFIFDS